MNTKNGLLIVTLFIGFSLSSIAGEKCTSVPSQGKWDTLTYIPASTPTNPSKGTGLWLGQGTMYRGVNDIRPAFIPKNHPTWALAIAHAWNYSRNTIQRVDYPQIGYWLATAVQESELACVPGTTWDDPSQASNSMATAAGTMSNGGCLQIEGPGSGYGLISQSYPNGRFPIDQAHFDLLVQSPTGFETSCLIKSYYDAYTGAMVNDYLGWDFYQSIDCTVDDYAYMKSSAARYNGGINRFMSNEGFYDGSNDNNECWQGLAAATAMYGRDVAKWASVLENDAGYDCYPTGSTFDSYYDDDVTWAIVEDYLDIIQPFYHDIDFTPVRAKAQAKFNALAVGGKIPFTEFGPVTDAIILSLPQEFPTTPVEGSPTSTAGAGMFKCNGKAVPYAHPEVVNGYAEMCLGQSVTLGMVVDAGGEPNMTYKWWKKGVPGDVLSTSSQITITPTEVGKVIYSAEVCNSNGCFKINCKNETACLDDQNLCGIEVEAKDCNLCPFVASATSENTPCRGMAKGKINLTLVNEPANYKITYFATTPLGTDTLEMEGSGNAIALEDIRDGAYNFVLEDLDDPTCKAYTSVIVDYDTEFNAYVDAQLNGIDACIADVEAVVKEQPSPCKWKVRVHQPVFYAWENFMNFGVAAFTGGKKKIAIGKYNHLDNGSPRVFSEYSITPYYEQSFYLSTGDSMAFSLSFSTVAIAARNYQVDVYDEDDIIVYTEELDVSKTEFTKPFVYGGYKVTCPDKVSDFTFSWDPGINNQVDTKVTSVGAVTASNIEKIYTVTATSVDNDQCYYKDTILVVDPTCISNCANPGTVTLINDSDVGLTDTVLSCTDSTLYVKLDGNDAGTFSYELYLDDVAQTPTNTTGEFTMLDDGEYYVLVSDDADAGNTDCHVYSDTIQFIKQIVPNAPLYKDGDTIVCAGATGDLIEVSTAVSATSYTWKYSGAGLTFNPIPLDTNATLDFADDAINGILTIVGENVCGADSLELSITVVAIPIVDLGNNTTVCAANGAFVLDAFNVEATYEWKDGSVDTTFNVTETGEYWAIASVGACADSDTVVITVVGDAILELGNDTALCDGDLTLDVGTGFSDVIWNGDNSSITQTLLLNTSGKYFVDVEDVFGCIGSDTINVTINQSPQVDLGADTVTICATSPAVTFDAGNPGADFNWSSGETGQSIQKGNADEGDYYIIATKNNCSDSDTVHLKVATELTVDLGDDREICTGTTIDLDAGFGAGFTFDWNKAGATVTQTFTTSEGTVTVLVADASGCEGKDTITITEVNPLQINLGVDQGICLGDAEVTFSMASGRSDVTVIGWNDLSTGLSLSTDQDGIYWLEVDSAGCVFRDSVVLKVNALPIVNLGKDTFICTGTTPIITLNGGTFVSYQWADLTNLIPLGISEMQDVSAIGTYALGVVDTNGCMYGDTIVVAEELGTAYSVSLDTSICPAGSAKINVPNDLQGVVGANWQWLIDNSTGTSYIVDNRLDGDRVEVILSFTNEFGCVTNDTSNVSVNNNLPISLKDTAVCAGEDIKFVSGYPSAGYTFTWFGGSTGNDLALTSVSDSDAGSISLSITSDEGCAGEITIDLVVNPIPDPQLSDGSICLGEDRVLDHGLSGVSTAWNTGEISNPIIVTTENRYSVTVTNDATGCSDTASVYLKVNTPPSVNLPNDQLPCEGETYILGTGFDDVDYTNQWAGGSSASTGSIDVATTGEYSVIVTDVATKCSTKDTVIFTFLEVPTVDLGPDTNICAGDVITLLNAGVDASYDFEWSTNEVSTTITVEESGAYSLKVVNGACSDQDEVKVTVYSLPESRLGNDTVVCFEDEPNGLSLNTGRVGNTYLWSTMETTQLIDINAPGTYVVDITNQVGCTKRDWIKVQEDCPSHVWLPNSFTPDGDGLNETWIIKGRSIETVEVLVYNRWGELIWEGHALGDFWDGTHMRYENEVQQDVYVYHLKYTYVNIGGGQESKSRIGTVTMLR